jgi:hypothetical protein
MMHSLEALFADLLVTAERDVPVHPGESGESGESQASAPPTARSRDGEQVAKTGESLTHRAARSPIFASDSPPREQRSGFSPNSPDSPEHRPGIRSLVAGALPPAWGDDEIRRFLDRRARLMRWGWTEAEAEAMAERLVLRDADDDRRMCVECQHCRTGLICTAYRAAGVARELGRDLATLLQRCPAFAPTGENLKEHPQ